MFTSQQRQLLENFAKASDKLFDMGVITTDSFTGEIGEYIACLHFKLKKSPKVTKAIDGECKGGFKYQIKSKIISGRKFNCHILNLRPECFNYLLVMFLDMNYSPIKVIRIPSNKIEGNNFYITNQLLNSGIESYEKSQIKIPPKVRQAINEFATSQNELEFNQIIRSRRVIGDIGELYAWNYLDL